MRVLIPLVRPCINTVPSRSLGRNRIDHVTRNSGEAWSIVILARCSCSGRRLCFSATGTRGRYTQPSGYAPAKSPCEGSGWIACGDFAPPFTSFSWPVSMLTQYSDDCYQRGSCVAQNWDWHQCNLFRIIRIRRRESFEPSCIGLDHRVFPKETAQAHVKASFNLRNRVRLCRTCCGSLLCRNGPSCHLRRQ